METKWPRLCSAKIPFWHDWNSNDVGSLIFSGFFGKYYNTIFSFLNWTVKEDDLLAAEMMDIGYITNDQPPTGALKFLADNESDVSLVMVHFGYKEYKYVDYQSTMGGFGLKLISALTIDVVSHDFDAIIIFNKKAWIAIFCSIIIVCWTILITTAKKSGKSYFQLYIEILISIMGLILLQGYHFTDNSYAKKFYFTFWIVGYFWITIGFSVLLFSRTSLPDTPLYYESLEDILKTPDVKLYTVENTAPHVFFMESKREVAKKVLEQMERTKSIIDGGKAMEILGEILANGTILIDLDTLNNVLDMMGICTELIDINPHVSKEDIITDLSTLMHRKGYSSPVLNKWKDYTKHYFEGGILLKDILDKRSETIACQAFMSKAIKTPVLKSMNIRAVYFPALVLVAGIALATMTHGFMSLSGETKTVKKISNTLGKRRRKRPLYIM